MEKVNGTYHFGNSYEENGIKQEATVALEIDYKNERYSIKPFCGPHDGTFKFETSSHKWRMWKAVLIGIEQAIDFGNKELKK